MLCTDRDFEKRLVALYVFAWLVFATFPLSLSLAQAKGFLRISTPFTGTRQNMQINRKEFFIYFSSSHSLTWRKCLTWYTADHHSAVRKIPWDWESAERRRLFLAQSLSVLSCPVVRAKSGKRRASESLSLTSHLTSGQHSLTSVERPSYLRSDFVNVWRHARLEVQYVILLHFLYPTCLIFGESFCPTFWIIPGLIPVNSNKKMPLPPFKGCFDVSSLFILRGEKDLSVDVTE